MNRMKQIVAGLSALLVMAAATATTHPTVDTAFAELQTEVDGLIDKGWPVVIAITVGLILFKLFKKVANRST